jgi:hypothetical protein
MRPLTITDFDERAEALEQQAREALREAARTVEPQHPGPHRAPEEWTAWRARYNAHYTALYAAEREALERVCGLTGSPWAEVVWELAGRYAYHLDLDFIRGELPYYCALALLVRKEGEGEDAQPA